MKKVIVLILVLAGLGTYAYRVHIQPGRQPDPRILGSGSIEAESVVVSPKIAARIRTMAASEGDRVEAGRVLVTLDCEEIAKRKSLAEVQIEQAQALVVQSSVAADQTRSQVEPLLVQREQAQRERDRVARLVEAGATGTQRLETAQAVLDTLDRQIAAARKAGATAGQAVGVAARQKAVLEESASSVDVALKECELVAPVGGVILARNYEPGEVVLPGAALLKIGRLEESYTWIYIPNEKMGKVRLGQKARLEADALPGTEFEGRVVQIREEAEFTPKSIQTKEDRTRLVFGVKVAVKNEEGKLKPGMPVEAELLDEPAPEPTP